MKKWMIVLLGILALSACSRDTSDLRIDSATQQVIQGDSELADALQVDDVDIQDMNGHSRSIVKVTNQESHDVLFQYRFYWYDATGIEVSLKQNNWRQIVLRAKESITLTEVAINPTATDFRIQMRPIEP